ncbi:MAG TPA: lipopolysaccharide biosynthesis protein [Acidothermaceae bacterium]|jgi:O-antigen/teichoic acid export membrane protein|nr:lipopolysaccharide biosynthesis protein [Acidothermaceae bacterium]
MSTSHRPSEVGPEEIGAALATATIQHPTVALEDSSVAAVVGQSSRRRRRAERGRYWHLLRRDDLVRNSIAMMATTVGNSALGYVFWILVAHRFSASEVGAASAVVSAAGIAATFADIGLRSTLMQELPRNRAGREWSSRVAGSMVVGSVTSLVAASIAWLGLLWLSGGTRAMLAGGWPLVLFGLTLALTLSTILDGVATAERRAGQVFVRNMLVAITKVSFVIVLAWLIGGPPQTIVLSTVLATLTGVAYGFFVQLRRAKGDWAFTLSGFGSAMRAVRRSLVGHHLLNLGGWLPTFVLPLEVVARLSTQQNAYFSFTWMVGGVFFMVSPSVAAALFVQGRWDLESLASTTRKAIKLIALLLGPVALGFVVFGRQILDIFGPDYSHYGYPLLVVLAISSVPDAITNVKVGQLRAQRRLSSGARLNLGMAITSLVLAWILLPGLGIVGAGVAWLVAQSAGSIWVVADRRR